jgi:hypothetical protein
MEDWETKLKALSDDELILLQELVANQLRLRRREPREWRRCEVCNGTGKRAGGYCLCAVGRDIRIVELGPTSSYELPTRWDDI